jgi:hypothetical protein
MSPLSFKAPFLFELELAKGITSARVLWCLSVAKFRAGFPLGLRFRARLGIISFSDCPSSHTHRADMQAKVNVSCPACRSTSIGEAVAVPDREYCMAYVARYAPCLECGTLFQIPMPSFEQLGAFYPAHYHAATAHGVLARARHRARLRQLEPLLQDLGALLDYGCGNGAFLLWAAGQNLGRPLFGYEIGTEREMQRLAGGAVTIIRGRPEHLLEVLPSCRLISMNHVIEHLPDPFTTIMALNASLVPGGSIQGQTPAADSRERRVFGKNWSGYHAPRHTVVFSRRGLGLMLERAGLHNPRVTPAFNPAAIAVSLAASTRPTSRGIARHGAGWIAWLGCATLLAPIDLAGGSSGIINFQAYRPTEP